jgi:polyisoprenoid-binding protein YceI
MKSRRILFGIFAVILSVVALNTASFAADTYNIDPVHSTAFFKVGHLGIGFVRGGFTDIAGTIVMDKKTPVSSSIEVTIKIDSIFTNNTKRDEDLKSANYFDAATYPTMGFKSVKVRKLKGNKVEITGNFTLHGVTKPIKIVAQYLGEGKDPWGGYRVAFASDFSILRSDYNMTQFIPMAGDKVDISLIFEGVKKK